MKMYKMRRFVVAALVCLITLIGITHASAATIHTHFFESIDVDLTEQQFQIMSVAMLRDEQLTVVAYSATDEVVPQITLLNPLGSTVAEDLNADGGEAAYIQHTTQQAGMFTFLVSRQGSQGGFIRVMIFEGTPLEPDVVYVDYLDPSAPSRAFMVATDPQNPFEMSVDLVEPEDQTVVIPDVFASRSSTEALAPEAERMSPIPENSLVSWVNSDELPFYTLNIRPFPETLRSTSSKLGGWLRPLVTTWVNFDYHLILGSGGQTQTVDRTYCIVDGIEVVGIAPGNRWVVVDAGSDAGIALVPHSSLNVDLTSDACDRVVPVEVHPDLAPVASGGSHSSSLGGLAPAGDPPPADGGDDVVTLYVPPVPGSDNGSASGESEPAPVVEVPAPPPTPAPPPAGFSISFACEDDAGALVIRAYHDTIPPPKYWRIFVDGNMEKAQPGMSVTTFAGISGLTTGGTYTISSWEVQDDNHALVTSGGGVTVTCP